METKSISIVVPVYNESHNLLDLYEQVSGVLKSIHSINWDFIFVNDGSTDKSYETLLEISRQFSDIKVLDLARNFGKEIALSAGVEAAKGSDAVICIDADLQHPPGVIKNFIDQWRDGSEIVIGVRIASEKEPILRKIGSTVYYKLAESLSDFEVVAQSTDFRLYDKKVVHEFLRATERNRMFRAIMDWMGFRRSYVEFVASARTRGMPTYSYKKLWSLAIQSLMGFSLWPLRLTGYLGVGIFISSAMILIWMLISTALHTSYVYTPLAMFTVTNTLLIGIVLMSIGIVALYIGTIHTEVINRPLYIIRERVGFAKE